METMDRYIRFDWAIKRLLRQKANFGVLEGLLTVLLNEEVKIVEILESENNQLTADDKFNRADIKAKNSKGEIIIVEIQNTRELYYLERILYGVAKAITEHISLGERYYEVKKIYSVSILYFDIGRGEDYLYHGQNTFLGVAIGHHQREGCHSDQVTRRSISRIFSNSRKRIRQSRCHPTRRMDKILENRKNTAGHRSTGTCRSQTETHLL